MKPLYRTFLATALLFVISLGTAQAALVALGDYTTDTDTGLDWLDGSLTAGISMNQVLVELGAGGSFEGWQVATLDQVHTYLTNADWIGAFDPANNMNIGFLVSFGSMTTDSFYNDWAGDLGADRYYDDPVGDFGNTRFVFDPVGDINGVTYYNNISPIDPSVVNQNASTWLVRTSVVPIPAALWLFLSGLTLLFGYARGRP